MKKRRLIFVFLAMVCCTCCSYQFKFLPPYDYNQRPSDRPVYEQTNQSNDSFPVYRWQLIPLVQWQVSRKAETVIK